MIRPRRSWSIVFRLSASYALITIALLALFGAFLYWSLKESLEVSARNTLADKISVMRQILSERPNDQEALEERYSGRAPRGAGASTTADCFTTTAIWLFNRRERRA